MLVTKRRQFANMNLSNTFRSIEKVTLFCAATMLFLTPPGINFFKQPNVNITEITVQDAEPLAVKFDTKPVSKPNLPSETVTMDFVSYTIKENLSTTYAFGEPAGCTSTTPDGLTTEQMLLNVEAQIGPEYDLAERRQTYIWNGEMGTMLNVMDDPYVFEFVFNGFQHPLTYRGDEVATIFMANGFVIWFREYADNFRLMAIPMKDGVLESKWASYVTSYWQLNGAPNDDRIYPVMKKLPCHWVVDAGYVTNETLTTMFNLDWHIPDYLSAGRQYLADTCAEANRISQEKIGHWDATSMCGPLAWTIVRDINGFPYRIGSWTKDAGAFTNANPKWNGQPWGTFDPSTFTLIHTDSSMAGYKFDEKGNLYPGDLIYSYAALYVTPGYFDHIFVVAGINENGTRLSVSNMVRNAPYADCSIEEVQLYTPADRETGVINHEWNGFNFGKTGTNGFDVFRWNWITYHVDGQPIQYAVRWGDTVETIAFDWKISPESLLETNGFSGAIQLTPGQVITLPAPPPFENS